MSLLSSVHAFLSTGVKVAEKNQNLFSHISFRGVRRFSWFSEEGSMQFCQVLLGLGHSSEVAKKD